jgi:competence protein ComEC
VGVAATLGGAHPVVLASAAFAALLVPILPSPRPHALRWAAVSGRLVFLAALLAGAAQARAHVRATQRDCRSSMPDGTQLDVRGVVVTEPQWGRVRVDVQDGLPDRCHVELSVRLVPGPDAPKAGESVRVLGIWRANPQGKIPDWAGELEALLVEQGMGSGARGLTRWRVDVARRIREVFPRHAALVSALVLARKNGLDADVRDDFARSGTAHLLAISGFHVAVVAGLLLAALRTAGFGRRLTAVAAALGVWGYVGFIGAPDAAVRAAVLLTFVAAGRCLGRPVHSGGALSTAFLVLLALDPAALLRPGFQLSFAGAAGLVIGAGTLEARFDRWMPGSRWRSLRSAVAAGVSATVATMPVAAWHFDRISLMGVPATLVGTPLVAVAIPGIFTAFALHLALPAAGAFLAGGVDVLLGVLVSVMDAAAALPFAVVRADRATLVTILIGMAVTRVLVFGARPLRVRYRAAGAAVGIVAVLSASPVIRAVASSGSVEVRILDVGQGDAIAILSPAGRWVLVDAGPGLPPNREDPYDLDVVRALRRAGVRRLEMLVLTHPDLDHIGGAPPIFETLEVASVGDPGRGRGTGPYLDALRAAEAEPASWVALERGDHLEIDGVTLDVLHPIADIPGDADPNDMSVVLLLRYGLFTALLTGDAPARVEEAVGADVGHVDLLKVAHHGSRTSSSERFLREVRPSVSVISAGLRNRYGHPHAEVEARIRRHSEQTLRTDRAGAVRLVARRDGTWDVEAEHERNPN